MALGFIGLGLMGEAMASNLIRKSGENVYVFDLDKSKVELMVSKGGIGCKRAQEVAAKSDIIFTSVPTGANVKSVHQEIYPVAKKGQIYVDTSTISPEESINLANEMKKYGASMLDTPLVKSRQAAIDGKLGIYAGGSTDDFNTVKPYLEMIGTDIIHMGNNGMGLVMKICHNMLVGEIQNGVNEMMILAEKFGISCQDFSKAISMGGASNSYLAGKAENIDRRDWSPAFSIENMYKDVNIARGMIKKEKLNLPGTEVVLEIYEKAVAENLLKEDFSATYKIVEKNIETNE